MQGHISATFQFLSSCAYDVGQNSQDETITRTCFGSEEPVQFSELLEAASFTLSFSVQQLVGILGQLAHQWWSPQNGAVPFCWGQEPNLSFPGIRGSAGPVPWPLLASVRRLESLFLTFRIVLEISGLSGMYVSWDLPSWIQKAYCSKERHFSGDSLIFCRWSLPYLICLVDIPSGSRSVISSR